MNPRQVEFYCFAPRPAHTDLPPLERAVLGVLKDARGFFVTMGLTPSLVCCLLGVPEVDERMVLTALRNLTAEGFAENPPMRPDRWRVRK